jgi:[ribosomal protein S5]-alanine N-acetyltransferase
VDDVHAYADDEEWARYLPVPHPYPREHAEQFIARQVLLDRDVHSSWATVFKGRVIGGINIRFFEEHRVAGIGWSISRPAWGQGLATEAAGAVMGAAFAGHDGLNRIEATADLRNLASQRVMEKLGMTREGVLRQSRVEKGELVDVAYYSVLRLEWRTSVRR